MIIGVASADYLRPSRTTTQMPQWGGSGWARLGQYVEHWAKHHTVVVGTAWGKPNGIDIEVEHPDGSKDHVRPDIVYMQRLMHGGLVDHILASRQSGQVIVNDIDDWYWGLDPRNQAFKQTHPKINTKENVSNYAAILAASDALTVSTPYLADRIPNRGQDITVIPNYVDVNRFSVVEQPEVPIVGWVGSTAHRSGDLQLLKGLLTQLDGVEFQHSGHGEHSPLFADEVGLPPNSVRTLPLSRHDDYPSLLTMSIGLVPLRDTPFNLAKSDIKGLEYSAAGIPFVASPSPAYVDLRDVWGPELVRIARRPHQFNSHIRNLMDRDLRTDIGRELRATVESTRDICFGVDETLAYLASLG